MKDVLPDFTTELRALLMKANRPELAQGIDALPIVDRCRCAGASCSSIYTAPKPDGAYGAGHSNLVLSPEKGMVVLDLVGNEIRYVEVLDRDDVRDVLFAALRHDTKSAPAPRGTLLTSPMVAGHPKP